MENLTVKYFHNEDEARLYLEKLRWSDGIVCPHCGVINNHYKLKANPDSKRPVREGVWKCKDCRKQFTVTVGTIFEGSHIPLHKWLLAVYLMCSSKKGISAHQLHRNLTVTYKSAWFMAHRIRYAISQPPLTKKMKGVVEVDETYVGGKGKGKRGRGTAKTPVVALVERKGRIKSTTVDRVSRKNLKGFIRENVDKTATVMTDDFTSYKGLDEEFKKHNIIRHSEKKYVEGEIHTNTVENYFSLLKRGITGIYHHVDKHHLHRYLSEFDFRYNTRKISDSERTINAIHKIEGKRLYYRD